MEDFPHPFPPSRPAPGSLWKLLRAGLVHNGYAYRPGLLQVLPRDERFIPDFKIARGGFYLTPFEAIPRWLQIYDDLEFIAPARLGRTSRAVCDSKKTRVKTDAFFLGYPQFLWKFVQDFLNPYEVILRNPFNVRFYRYTANIVQMEDAVTADPHALQYIYPQPMGVSIMAVEKNGLALRHVRHKAPEVCLAAVKQNGMALGYIEKQNSKFQHIRAVDLDPILMEAVSQNGMALGFVQDKIPDLCKMAVEKSPMALMYVPEYNKTKEICQIAYRGNPETLRFIPDALKGEIQTEGKYEAFSKSIVIH
jgi:hypothetical protein